MWLWQFLKAILPTGQRMSISINREGSLSGTYERENRQGNNIWVLVHDTPEWLQVLWQSFELLLCSSDKLLVLFSLVWIGFLSLAVQSVLAEDSSLILHLHHHILFLHQLRCFSSGSQPVAVHLLRWVASVHTTPYAIWSVDCRGELSHLYLQFSKFSFQTHMYNTHIVIPLDIPILIVITQIKWRLLHWRHLN